jgi:uroporphyrinogen-III decarboxylase
MVEGGYTSRLEIIKDVPKGKIIYWFEDVDMKKAKEVLAGRVCIMGNVPMSLLAMGTPEEVKTCCKNLIDTAGKDGGYIMCPASGGLDDVKPDNLRAMFEFTREYGVY